MDGKTAMKFNYKNYMLLIITLFAGLLISGISYFLNDQILETKRKVEMKIRKQFFPRAVQFISTEEDPILPGSKNLLEVRDDKNETLGYLYAASDPNGYGGKVDYLIALNANWTIKDYKMMKHSETPGLGTKADGKDFRKAFAGIKPLGHLLPVNKKEFPKKLKIEAISGATLSSMATVRALAQGEPYVNWHKAKMKRLEEAEKIILQEYEKNRLLFHRRLRYRRYRVRQLMKEAGVGED